MAFAAHLMLPFAERLRPTSRRGQSERALGQHNPPAEAGQEQRLRGVIGYHNAFKDVDMLDSVDDLPPPSYHMSHSRPRRHSYNDVDHLHMQLPDYNCSVFVQARLDVKIERKSPFDAVPDPKWDHVYVVLQGTMLNIHAVKSTSPLSIAANPAAHTDYRAGKLLRSYTLQHAEAGLAADHHKFELVPKSHLVYLLSSTAQRHLQLTEPAKFDRVYQYVIRLRLEDQQLLLRFKSSADRTFWMSKLSAAIDIAPPLEVRAEPRNITLPRRRRRRPNQGEGVALDALREQQARIIREHYPQLAQDLQEEQGEPDSVQDFDDGRATDQGGADGADRDAEHYEEQPVSSTSAPTQPDDTSRQVNQIFQANTATHEARIELSATISHGGPQSGEDVEQTDFDDDGKWAPHIQRDAAQESRIRRRCMPSLLFNSKRASNVIVVQSRRVEIDWEARNLKPWPEAPPTYASTQDDSLSPPGSPLFEADSQNRNNFTQHGPAQRSTRNLLMRIRSTPERIRPEQFESSNAQNSTMDDVTSSDGSSHHTPAPKNFLSRTANRIRRLTNRQQDMAPNNSKTDATADAQAIAERDALSKLQPDVNTTGSTATLTVPGVNEQRSGF